MSTVRPPKARRAFSLIELLVVIAVIAILAALLFPVFASVREKARQATVISNMHQIQVGMAQYQLDYHKYPDVLFGYALPNQSMANYTPVATSPPTLFSPQYIKDYHVFLDPNNQADPASTSPVSLSVDTVDTAGKLSTATTKSFYKADAYDISPQVTGKNAVSGTNYVPRYQLNWTSLTGNTAPTGLSSPSLYQKQLRWKTIPGDTFVTCTTYHVQNADKVITLYESGTAKVIDSTKFLAPGPDVAALSASGDVSNAKFWQVQP